MDSQSAFQGVFHSTINDMEENIFDMGEIFDNVPDTRERFKLLGRLLHEKWNRSNQIIQNQSQKLMELNRDNYDLVCLVINLKQRIHELESQKNARVESSQIHYESLQTPVTSRNINDENSDPDVILELNKELQSKSICKSVSSPAIMTNAKHKAGSGFKKEFRLFNTKISISHGKRLNKDIDENSSSNDNEKNTLDRMDTRSSLINLFKKPKKDHKQKSKRLSSSLIENLRVFDKDS